MVNGLYLNEYMNNLNQQISSSVDRIKQKPDRLNPIASAVKEDSSSQSHNYNSLHSYAYQLLETDVSYNLTAFNSAEPKQLQDSNYAAGSYNQADKVDKPSTVLLDFMFANNREFDFKV